MGLSNHFPVLKLDFDPRRRLNPFCACLRWDRRAMHAGLGGTRTADSAPHIVGFRLALTIRKNMCVLNPSGLAGCHMFHYFGPPPRQALWGAHMLAGLPSRLLAHPNRPKIDPELPRPDLGNLAKILLLMVSLPPGAAQPPYLEWTPGRSGPPRPLKPTISGWPKNHVVKN